MTNVGEPERQTQNKVIAYFTEQLGYQYLGNWEDRANNSNVFADDLLAFLTQQGLSEERAQTVFTDVQKQSRLNNRSLYEANKDFYQTLRYGVQRKFSASEDTRTIPLINWQQPEANIFGIAEEVSVTGKDRTKRPDLVLYVNGIALAVIELKSTRKSLENGIRQSINNQQPGWIPGFFTTLQLVLAGNETQGLRYGTIGTSEKYFMRWKEDEEDPSAGLLLKYLGKLCRKDRLVELVKDFVVFDGGVKKLPRVHQYFGVKAAQEAMDEKRSGIIWHTQGSGKSITMVLLARWILENNPNGRVLVLTDRDELDKQIEKVFTNSNETIYRTRSGEDLLTKLGQQKERLLCSLIHKFGKRDIRDFEQYIRELEERPSRAVGELYVFVDECHRTQSGKLHRLMKSMLPGAVFIGFTGTPLLKKDKATSREVFGSYIHTYKFNEAVEDEIVKDLVYEARDVDQRIASPERVDQWFEAKTRRLNNYQKAALKKKWGTMQQVLSAHSRRDKIIEDIVLDFNTRPRLESGRGNAILVASSIYEACKYYEQFQRTELKGKCAVVTSYNPYHGHVSTEETGANTETDKQFIYNLYEKELLKDIAPQPNKTKSEVYEDRAKKLFVEEPANMRLLIVVDKLLTGFDAPSCTYIYLDKKMQDHGLFQAICRVNRLDGDDKLFGYIIDYKDLFEQVTGAIGVYTSELDEEEGTSSNQVTLGDRISKGREKLEEAREALHALCEPVPQPRDSDAFRRYFCGNIEKPTDLKETEPRRIALYQLITAFLRAHANIADNLREAGYTEQEIKKLEEDKNFYSRLRDEIKLASGETIDLKAYEADMRYLLDKYVTADPSRVVSPFEDMPLLDYLNKVGIEEVMNNLPGSMQENREAAAETIVNNVRQRIMRDQLLDPAYYDKMSRLLQELVDRRREEALAYEEYLKELAALAQQVQNGPEEDVPVSLNTPGKKALFNNLEEDEELALACDEAIHQASYDDWRGNQAKERIIKSALYEILQDPDKVERIFQIVKKQQEY